MLANLIDPRGHLGSSLSLERLEFFEYRLGPVLVHDALGNTDHGVPNKGGKRLSLVLRYHLKQASLISGHTEADGRGLISHISSAPS
jgi:hypothetical protein